eukprot:3270443-Prorocentrum_lima.AAC.1
MISLRLLHPAVAVKNLSHATLLEPLCAQQGRKTLRNHWQSPVTPFSRFYLFKRWENEKALAALEGRKPHMAQ